MQTQHIQPVGGLKQTLKKTNLHFVTHFFNPEIKYYSILELQQHIKKEKCPQHFHIQYSAQIESVKCL